jgi:dolichol-phosphate mannosyltransferase
MSPASDSSHPGVPGPPPVDLSVVIPVFNEEENIPALYRRLTDALETLGRRYEAVFVDDGSRDRSTALISEITRRDPRVRLV